MGGMMRLIICVTLLLASSLVYSWPKADFVLVNKSERKLYLLQKGMPFREYQVSLGPQPRGHKLKEGDERTPEGRYILDFKKENSDFYKSIHISYPNQFDLEQARGAGVSAGGSIMIHGLPGVLEFPAAVIQSFNWTDGCIAVTNEEMDEIWNAVDIGTPIEILP
jgi:murein L,D-transpeptidase YafK